MQIAFNKDWFLWDLRLSRRRKNCGGFLGYTAVYSGRWVQKFRRYLLPPSSRHNVNDSSMFPDTQVTTYENIRLYNSTTYLSFSAYRFDFIIADLVAIKWRFQASPWVFRSCIQLPWLNETFCVVNGIAKEEAHVCGLSFFIARCWLQDLWLASL
jgi:hypothetical protein